MMLEAIAEPLQTDPKENYPARAKITGRGSQSYTTAHNGSPSQDKSGGFPPRDDVTRNARNVWTITTCPYPEAHFATFPPESRRALHQGGHQREGLLPRLRRLVGAGGGAREPAELHRHRTEAQWHLLPIQSRRRSEQR